MPTFISRFAGEAVGRTLAVKDLIDLAGHPTTAGSRAIADRAAPAVVDAACLAGTRAAEARGEATIVGKTNLHELAFGVTGINPWFGTPVNPLDPARVPGGSSSGSAVAVATGDADISFGTDTGGSIRIPAACCGVVGLKTTWGRIPTEGVTPLAPSLDTVGPLALDVAGTIEGMRLLEPGFEPSDSPAARIGRVRVPAEPRVDAAIDAALKAAGIAVAEVALPGWDPATAATMTVLSAEAWATHQDLLAGHGDELGTDVASRLRAASQLTGAAVQAARAQLRAWQAELRAVWEATPVLALPTLAEAPPTVEDADRMARIRHTAAINGAGVPALSLPVAAGEGFPASLQLVGPPGAEAVLLSTAALIEAAIS